MKLTYPFSEVDKSDLNGLCLVGLEFLVGNGSIGFAPYDRLDKIVPSQKFA